MNLVTNFLCYVKTTLVVFFYVDMGEGDASLSTAVDVHYG